jgi:dTDP-D-glucose 4,6-dehydratase
MGQNQWRPFIHVRDLARAVVAVLKADPEIARDQIFNVGDRRLNMTIGALAEEVKRIVSKERPVEILLRPDVNDRRNYMVNFDKIRRVLRFEASTLLEPGIQDIVDEFKRGTYGHYKDATYSNLEMTKRALSLFQDPQQSARLYVPLNEMQQVPRTLADAQPAVAK